LALAAFMLVVIIGLPTLFIGLISWLAIAIKLQRVSPRTINLLRIIAYLRFWNMAEIFFLGILISMVKIASLAHVSVGYSFWAYGMFNLSLIAAMMHLDKFQLGQSIRRIVREKQAVLHGH
jgi:paraquat-inducible protein A